MLLILNKVGACECIMYHKCDYNPVINIYSYVYNLHFITSVQISIICKIVSLAFDMCCILTYLISLIFRVTVSIGF